MPWKFTTDVDTEKVKSGMWQHTSTYSGLFHGKINRILCGLYHTHSPIKVKLGMLYFALIVSVTIWPFCSGSEKLSVNGACTITTLYLQKYQRSKLFNWQIDLNFTVEMYDGQTKTSVFCCDRASTLAITNSINIHVRETGAEIRHLP